MSDMNVYISVTSYKLTVTITRWFVSSSGTDTPKASYMSVSVRQSNAIDEEHLTIEKLLIGAKNGKWEHVWEVLGTHVQPRKSYLINVIPQKRRFSVLHQAVSWNNVDVLKRLLTFMICDVSISTKLCISDRGEYNIQTAEGLAQHKGYHSLVAVLKDHVSHFGNSDNIPTFNSYSEFNEQFGLGLISLTLAAYKEAFHPTKIDTNKSVTDVLKSIWTDIQTSQSRWREIRDVVADAVVPVCRENSQNIKDCKTRHELFVAIINTYTLEENYMYTYLNMAFRRQRQEKYEPTGADLALGPFAVVYQMLLLFWSELHREGTTTYRRMKLKHADCNEYTKGKRFVWPSVVSSSTVRECAVAFPTCGVAGDVAVVFTIDNSTPCNRQPRNIERYASYMEHERTYPAGSRFQVMSRYTTSDGTAISLKLLLC